ncbi:MAG TPA: hypothetical protein VGF84_13960 [Micromonosporaceae bacterium]
MSSDADAKRLEEAEQQVFDEQESNARATAGTSPRDDDQADELAGEAELEEQAATDE